MEQEETKTTAAAGVEMPPEAESWVQLHESELTELMQKQAKAAITELKRQEKQERKDYVLNTNYSMGVKKYEDNDTDDQITKGIMLVDGKVVDKNSLVVVKKIEAV